MRLHNVIKAIGVTIADERLYVDLENGRTISVPIGWYPRLAHGTVSEWQNYELSGGGRGIYWPELDEDIGVDGLLLGKQSMESSTSFARWLKRR